MLISHWGHTDTIQVYSVTVMTHVKALQAGHSSQGTSEPITPAPILDVRNSLLIAFLAISDQYATFFKNYYKKATGAHFGCPKFTFDRISGHFRSIRNFFFVGNFYFCEFFTRWLPAAILDVRNSL